VAIDANGTSAQRALHSRGHRLDDGGGGDLDGSLRTPPLLEASETLEVSDEGAALSLAGSSFAAAAHLGVDIGSTDAQTGRPRTRPDRVGGR